MLPIDVLKIIFDMLSGQSKDLLGFASTSRQMDALLKQLRKVDKSHGLRLDLLLELDRLNRIDAKVQSVFERDLAKYKSKADKLTAKMKVAVGIQTSFWHSQEDAGQQLVAALTKRRMGLRMFADSTRVRMKHTMGVFGEVHEFLQRNGNAQDPRNEKLRLTLENSFDALSSNRTTKERFNIVERSVIKPFNDCVVACEMLKLGNVPKKLKGW